LRSKQKLKTYLIINIFVNANKILQIIERKEREILRLRANKKNQKIISFNIVVFINFIYSKILL